MSCIHQKIGLLIKIWLVSGVFCAYQHLSRLFFVTLPSNNSNLITAFKVDVKVSQSYTNENGGKVGSDIVENVVEKDLIDVAKPSDVVENVVENKENVVENILASISKNSTISTKKLAAMCSLSERQVQRIMTKLKEQGVIRRIGPDKGGHWEIIAP